jgi:integrase
VKLGADLFDPESVKDCMARQSWSEGRKANVIYAYDLFAKWASIKWVPPKVSIPEKLPFIPLEREIDDLIAGCSKHVSVALQIAKETGARIGEIFRLKWTDMDFENGVLKITPEKGGKPRIFRMSSKLIQMLNSLPKGEPRILSRYKNLNSLRRTFEKQRRKIAFKLSNPRLLQISFHTFRHWKATMEYYKTKDILHVMRLLGHKNIKNTLIYTQLIENVEGNDSEYISKVAGTVEEARALVEAGFEYVCDIEGVKIFRKRK